MDDNKNQNQPDQTANDYQKILDDYAASIKPETSEITSTPDEESTPLTTASLEEVKTQEEPKEIPVVEDKDISTTPNKNQFLKDVNSLQLESPIHHSLAANLEPDDVLDQPIQSSTLNTEAENFTKNKSFDYQETPKTPEEIKAEINRILADDNPTDSSVGSTSFQPPKPGLNLFKTFFIITLVLFLIIASVLAYTLFNSSTSNSDSDNTNKSVIPTISSNNSNTNDSTEVCNLNGKTYKIGDSFASADGCNTCSCESAEVIACTEKACNITPTSTSATKSATKTPTKVTLTPTKSTTTSSIPKDWKTYTSNLNFSISLPNNWKLVYPADGSLDTGNLEDNYFDIDSLGGLLTTVSSPDKKQEITLTNIMDMGTAKCTSKISTINNQQVKKTTCSGVNNNDVPGPINYEFIGKGLYIITSSSTTTIDSIINNIKFN